MNFNYRFFHLFSIFITLLSAIAIEAGLSLSSADNFVYQSLSRNPDWGFGYRMKGLSDGAWAYDGALNPEFLAYILKVPQLVEGTQPTVVRVVYAAGTYMLVLYDNTNANGFSYNVIGTMTLKSNDNSKSKDLSLPRIASCRKIRNANNGSWSCLSSYTPQSKEAQENYLSTHLANITQQIVQLIPDYLSSSNYLNKDITHHEQLHDSILINAPYIYGQSIGTLSGYYKLVQYMLSDPAQNQADPEIRNYAPFPLSDTSDAMLNINASSLYNHPFYLYFSANQFARSHFLSDSKSDVFKLLVQTVLLHRFKELDDVVFSESINNTQAYDDYYEFMVIMNKLLPKNNDLSTSLKDWDQDNAATKFMAVDPQVIVNARKIIEKFLNSAIDDVYTQGIITVGKLYTAPPAGQASSGPQKFVLKKIQ